jgi:hypothetical protein
VVILELFGGRTFRHSGSPEILTLGLFPEFAKANDTS